MKDFTKGALFVVGAVLFGKYMYERGAKDKAKEVEENNDENEVVEVTNTSEEAESQ